MSGQAGGCPQAWHGGLPVGLLIECDLEAKHRGWHRDADRKLSWGGKLTDDELARAEKLRAQAAEEDVLDGYEATVSEAWRSR